MAFRKGLPETPQKKDLTKFTVYILRLIEAALRITIVRCLLSTVRCPLLQSPCECVCNVFIKTIIVHILVLTASLYGHVEQLDSRGSPVL